MYELAYFMFNRETTKWSKTGVSNSVVYVTYKLTQENEITGRVNMKTVIAGHNRRVKMLQNYKNSSFSYNMSNFDDVATRTNT